MNPENLKVLAERASTVEGRAVERLDEVHARIAQVRRRRQVGVVVAAVVAVVLALTAGLGAMALTDTDQTPPAKPAPLPTRAPGPPEEEKPSGRQLAYADGHTIHWGDRTVDVGGEVTQLTATDDGVLFIRDGDAQPEGCSSAGGGCDELWFTDGVEVSRIGKVFGTVIRGFRIDTSTAGSTVVWFEPATDTRSSNAVYRERGEYVAYDTGERRELGRFGSADSQIRAVFDGHVYWTPDEKTSCRDFSKYYGGCRRFKTIRQFDTSTGTQSEVPWASYISDRSGSPRMFSLPIRTETNNPGPVYEEGITLGRAGRRLLADDGDGGLVTARVARTGEPVRLRVPGSYPDVEWFFMTMWLDDDRVVLQADNDDSLLVCRLPGGQCHTVVKGPVVADFGGRG